MSDEIKECRICFEGEKEDDLFISPCRCSGTSKYVHYSDGGMTAQPPVTFLFHLASKASLACARGKV